MPQTIKFKNCDLSAYECQLATALKLHVRARDNSLLNDPTISDIVTRETRKGREYLDCTNLAPQVFKLQSNLYYNVVKDPYWQTEAKEVYRRWLLNPRAGKVW